jgi:hypothetical protein
VGIERPTCLLTGADATPHPVAPRLRGGQFVG